MRWVQSPAIRPHRCAAIPFISQDPKGFVDTGTDLMGWDPHVYLSVTAVEQAARLIGWVPSGAIFQAEQAKDRLKAQLDEKDRLIEELTRQMDAMEIVKRAILERQKQEA